MPGEEEVAENPRANSSVLRIAERGRMHDQQVTEALSKVKGSMGSHERHALLVLSVTIFAI